MVLLCGVLLLIYQTGYVCSFEFRNHQNIENILNKKKKERKKKRNATIIFHLIESKLRIRNQFSFTSALDIRLPNAKYNILFCEKTNIPSGRFYE